MRNNFARLLCLVVLCGCGQSPFEGNAYARHKGQTMGTYFTVQFDSAQCAVELSALDDILGRVNRIMSTYDPNSELSRFNADTSLNWVQISAELAQVLSAAEEVWRVSAGAFDVTVGPLVELWGFGAVDRDDVPGVDLQKQAAANVGMDKLEIRRSHGGQTPVTEIRKLAPGLSIDLSALAKGYGVDVLAEHLESAGCADYMVDIGGEIRLGGLSARGESWRIGVEMPQTGAVQQVMYLSGVGVATSGDYRNFRIVNGKRVDHVFDPRTARPADNMVVSATVIHPSTMWADAWATTLMVLGAQEGLELAARMALPVFILTRTTQQTDDLVYDEGYTDYMQPYLRPPQTTVKGTAP